MGVLTICRNRTSSAEAHEGEIGHRSGNVEPIVDAHIAEKLNTRWTEAGVEH